MIECNITTKDDKLSFASKNITINRIFKNKFGQGGR